MTTTTVALSSPQVVQPPSMLSATKTSELLQLNHEKYHIFFDNFTKIGLAMHNHIPHQVLTLLALGASAEEIQKGYDASAAYQRTSGSVNYDAVSQMSSWQGLQSFYGDDSYYRSYLHFFSQETEKRGWPSVLQTYLFAGSEESDRFLARHFAGVVHPIIHLGFGVEFEAPGVIAEALAQAAIHDNRHCDAIARILLSTDALVKSGSSSSCSSIAKLIDEIRNDEKLRDAVRPSDMNPLLMGTIGRANDHMASIAAKFQVLPDSADIERKTAEMYNAVVYYTAGAQRAERHVKFDFFYMHCVNLSLFLEVFRKQEWMTDAQKARLLQWKVSMDLAIYSSRGAPEPQLHEIRNHKPSKPSGWDGIIQRAIDFHDDCHVVKLIRALIRGQSICAPYEDCDDFRIKHDDWLQIGHMVVDSVSIGEPYWIRSAGFDHAWEDVPLRQKL
ncbi:hypothetical protein CBER1_03425 [Cercospora berteroae]|uniref:Oxidoreductase AflY n=1 Tax=Cercospora berteroae TaxID=357750 RepID=A0A2S6C8F4_9PEZI|nr:hypothetical protein CBER1_03425 [Cercospora berteroae]